MVSDFILIRTGSTYKLHAKFAAGRLLKPFILLLISFFCRADLIYSQDCSNGMSGIYKIGPSGNFLTIQAAIDALKSAGVADAVVLELQAGYSGSVESFPVRLDSIPCASSTRTITIRPETGAVSLQIVGNNDTTVMDINNGSWYIIDGRSGGSGAKQLTIQNTNLSGSALRLVNDARNNHIQNINLRGVNNTLDGGVINIAGTNRAVGNDSNYIQACDIFDGATTPTNGIVAVGAFGKKNSCLTIKDCNIYNFFSSTLNSSGIYISSNNDSVNIENNSIYQTSTRNYSLVQSITVFGIRVLSSTSGGHRIINNYIGGMAPLASGGRMRLSGSILYYRGISIANGNGAAMRSLVSGNTITNIAIQAANSSTVILDLGYWNTNFSGNFNGDCVNNHVGSPELDSAIIFRASDQSGNYAAWGIALMAQSTVDSSNINGNTVAGLYADSLSAGAISLAGIYVDGSRNVIRLGISDNLIGSETKKRSIENLAQGTIYGIYVDFVATGSISIRNNTVVNVHAGGANGHPNSGYLWGITTYTGQGKGVFAVDGNTVKHLSRDHAQPTGSSPSIAGIYAFSTSLSSGVINFAFTNNRIWGLTASPNTSTSNGHSAFGMYINCPGTNSRTNVSISHNFMHSINACYSEFISFGAAGIFINNSAASMTIDNNMISLGLDSLGASWTDHVGFAGIADYSDGAIENILHNTIYIGGSAPSPYGYSYVLYANQSGGAVRNIVNNIFVNNRNPDAAAPASNIVIGLGNSNTLPGLNLDYNLLYCPGSFGVFGTYRSSTCYTPLAWQVATGMDTHSLFEDPRLINPLASAALTNLHVMSLSPIEGAGNILFTTATDFDGELRANLTPVDIGADAGLFITGFTTIADGNWNDPSIWAGGVVPTAASRVRINNTVTVTADTACYSLLVNQPAGNLIILPGITLTVTH